MKINVVLFCGFLDYGQGINVLSLQGDFMRQEVGGKVQLLRILGMSSMTSLKIIEMTHTKNQNKDG